MLFHVTITHDATDCPGRRPGEPPELVGPSDKRAELARELRVTSHFVLWGASCLLWAQPEHVTYAVLEAEDVEAVLEYVTAITPPGWRSTAVPVWNLPSQFRLVRNVLMAAAGIEKEALVGDAAAAGAPAPTSPEGVVASETTPLTELAGDQAPGVTPVGAEPGSGTITRLFQALESGTDPGAGRGTPGSTTSPGGLSAQVDMPTVIPDAAPANGHIRLVCIAGPSEGETFDIAQERATLGRLPENAIYIPDGRLSRTHASIERRDDGYWLSDLGSLNGTAVNGVLLEGAHRLQTGDTIELGATRLVVTIEPGYAG